MEKKYKIGVVCFDLQNFTADFLNRLQYQIKDLAVLTAYPIIDNIGDIPLQFSYSKGEDVAKHRVKTYTKNDRHTPEGLLISANIKNAIRCARESDLIIHYGIHSTTALLSGFVGWILRRKQISVNQTLPVSWERKRKWWIRWSKMLFFKICNLHVIQSEISGANLKEVYKISQDKLRYIPFEAGIYSFKEKFDKIKKVEFDEPKFENENLTLLFVGNLLVFKGVYLLLDAIAHLKKKSIEVNLIMIGPESIEIKEPRISDLERRCEELNISRQVKILGSKTLDELAGFYNYADVFVLPTMKDCFPKVLVEAGVAGMPMITSDACGAINSIVINDVNGFIFKSGSVTDLAHKIELFLGKDKTQEMRHNTKSIITNYLELAKNEANLYHKVILEVIK